MHAATQAEQNPSNNIWIYPLDTVHTW